MVFTDCTMWHQTGLDHVNAHRLFTWALQWYGNILEEKYVIFWLLRVYISVNGHPGHLNISSCWLHAIKHISVLSEDSLAAFALILSLHYLAEPAVLQQNVSTNSTFKPFMSQFSSAFVIWTVRGNVLHCSHKKGSDGSDLVVVFKYNINFVSNSIHLWLQT